MKTARIIAIGDNVADQYLSRGIMYPGGQCVNTCVYSKMNGGEPAYLGKFGDDAVADYNCKILTKLGIDFSHSRHFTGENGTARVTLKGGDRLFLGSNKGGVAKEHPYDFSEEDLSYIRRFQIIYSNTNSYILEDLPLLYQTGVPIAFDFSTEWDQELTAKVFPYAQIVLLSATNLSPAEREARMKQAAGLGAKLAIATMGEKGSCALYAGEMIPMQAFKAEYVLDTMGAGDSYFAAVMTTLLQNGDILFEDDLERMKKRITEAMRRGAEFAAKVCGMEGAFGFGTPIVK